MNRLYSLCPLIGAAALAFTFSASAQVMMLDFRSPAPSGDSLTNSPYHTVDSGFTDTIWNVQGQGSDSTLTWSDGTEATGISYTTFKNGSGGSTSLSAAGWSGSVTGSVVNTGIYADTSAGADGYMMTTTFTNNRYIGIQMSGLSNGIYDVYVSGRNTAYADPSYTLNYFYSTVASTGSYNIASYASESVTFAASSTDKTSAWVFDSEDPSASNYVKFTISITDENPYFNLAAAGDGVNGIFSSIQIVAVPEPSSFAMIGGLICLAWVATSRRSR